MNPFDFSSSPFGTKLSIPASTKVIFVADMFVEDYVGGAELTSQALIDASPFEVFKLKSRDVTMELLQQGAERFWVFGNFCEMSPQLIPTVIANLRYSVLEYDYKFCRYRSPEKHFHTSGTPCDCPNQEGGRMVSAFFYGSMGTWWMSEAQRERYMTAFPYLQEKDSYVLSSVFSQQTLARLHQLRLSAGPRKGWVVLGSQSWIKGFDDAEKWCKDNGKDYEVVWNLPYDQVLQKLASAEGFVYLPKGGDTCPRMVIEAKLLGCKLHLNENVQHKDEEWFATDDLGAIQNRLSLSAGLFWTGEHGIKDMMEFRPSVSGYTTAYNAIKQQYPFEQCIKSMLAFCDEVCVVDGGSTDGTWERLVELAHPDAMKLGHVKHIQLIEDLRAIGVSPHQTDLEPTKLRLKSVPRDWKAKRHPVFDGMQKAEARAMCTKPFCWQMDSDEIVHEDDGKRILELCRSLPGGVDLLALPVIEYWGGPEKVRMDIQPWKWRLSRNRPHITHGIPVELRRVDADGQPYAGQGTDGCDMIDAGTGERIPFISFYTQEVEQARQAAMMGNEQARQQYEHWFNQVVVGLPGVFHYSWYDLPRKIKLYRDYWQNHWNALWDKDASDTAENNLMFGMPWRMVSDDQIEQRAAQMKERLGGWIWHKAWDGKATTPHIRCNRTQPKVML